MLGAEKNLQDELLKSIQRFFEEPVFQTEKVEVAMQAIFILGREYSLLSYGKNNYRIQLSYSHDIIRELFRLLPLISNDNTKAYSQYVNITDAFFKLTDHARQTCATIEQVFSNQQAEKEKLEKERIEREEEIRAKYRNWR